MRVSNPGVWMILAAVIILLVGICVWGIFGHMDSKLTTVGVAQGGKVVCYVKEDDIDRVNEGELVKINGNEYHTDAISPLANAVPSDSVMAAGNFSKDDNLYAVTVYADISDGLYKVVFITDRIAPISFVIN